MRTRWPRFDPDERSLPSLAAHRGGWSRFMYARYLAALPLAAGRDTLDAGCGLGWGAYLLAGRARRVTGVDADAEAIGFAREAWPASNLDFQARKLDEFLAENPGRFGLVTAMEIIEHFDRSDGERHLRLMAAALHPPGGLILSSGFPADRHRADEMLKANRHHCHLWTKPEIRAILAELFETVSFDGSTMVFATDKRR